MLTSTTCVQVKASFLANNILSVVILYPFQDLARHKMSVTSLSVIWCCKVSLMFNFTRRSWFNSQLFVFCLFSSPNSIWSVLNVCSSIVTNISPGTSYSSVRDHEAGCEGARPISRAATVRSYISSLWLFLWPLPLGRSPGPGGEHWPGPGDRYRAV